MHCKDCKWKNGQVCKNPYLYDGWSEPKEISINQCLSVFVEDSVAFYVGDYFGCIHFEVKSDSELK